jgi:galactokinase
MRVTATAAGRVNLIGDHTDYMGGLVLPMAIQLGTTLEARVGGPRIQLTSDMEPEGLDLTLPSTDPSAVQPEWGRYVAAVAAELGSTSGLAGTLTSTIPAGAGLSSSAALEVATALALLAATPEQATDEDPSTGLPPALVAAAGNPTNLDADQRVEVASLCQRAEHTAVGVPSGIMDQLSICLGVAGAATLIDCATLEVAQVALPDDAAVWVIHSGESRRLAGSSYADRRACAENAAESLGPLPAADPSEIEALVDPVLRKRARHVRSECDRVIRFSESLTGGDLPGAGQLMLASHRSLSCDYEVSTSALDDLVDALAALPGVYGARLTGAGFGGCVVALTDPGIDLGDTPLGTHGAWHVVPSDGISVELR